MQRHIITVIHNFMALNSLDQIFS